mmetsp:Transcript_24501/g.79972  ORF Transcript_24501/g.79972 Transcript_24501/m.79972 type:complete len:696 (+) Transcript_24501:35-2122(+)
MATKVLPEEDGSTPKKSQKLRPLVLRSKSYNARNYADEEEDEDEKRMAAASQKVRSRWIMLPESYFRKRWDLTQAIILIYISICVPFRVGYDLPSTGVAFLVDLLIDMYFYIDIVLNFFTAVQSDENDYIDTFKGISRAYLSSWFFIDIIACLPIDIALRMMDGNFVCSLDFEEGCPDEASTSASGQLMRMLKLVRLFRLMKLLRLVKIGRLFERYQDDLFKYRYLVSVGQLLVFLLYLGHLFGCFFFFFSSPEWRTETEAAQVEEGIITPWIFEMFQDTPSEVENVLDRYIASMYWAFTTMTTVGYGDISAKTVSERIFAILGMIVGGFVFSAIVNTMSTVMNKKDLSKQAHAEKIEAVSAFISDYRLPQEYTKMVLGFFRKQTHLAYNERELLMEMPYDMRRRILHYKFSELILKVSLFDKDGDGEIDDHVFVTELCSVFHLVKFSRGQMVYEIGEVARDMYIVSSGACEIVSEIGEDGEYDVFEVVMVGGFFGEGAMLQETRRDGNVVSQHCELCQIDEDDMGTLLESYPHMLRQLREMKVARRRCYARLEMQFKAGGGGGDDDPAGDGPPPITAADIAGETQRLRAEKGGASDDAESSSEADHDEFLAVAPLSNGDGSGAVAHALAGAHAAAVTAASGAANDAVGLAPGDANHLWKTIAQHERAQKKIEKKLDHITSLVEHLLSKESSHRR